MRLVSFSQPSRVCPNLRPTNSIRSDDIGQHARDILDDVSVESASAAVQALRQGLVGLDDRYTGQGDNVRKQAEARACITKFTQTEFGRNCSDWYVSHGWTMFPLFGAEDSAERTRSMQRALEEKLLEEVEEGRGFKIPDDLRQAAHRINSQERYMVDMGMKGRLDLGKEFERNAKDMGQTTCFLLQAIDYGWREDAEMEKLTLLISAARKDVQVRCWLPTKGCGWEGVQRARMRWSTCYNVLMPRLADHSHVLNADFTFRPRPEENRRQVENRWQWDPCSIRTCPALGPLCFHGGHCASCYQQQPLGRERRVRLGRC